MFGFEHRVTGNIADVFNNTHGYYEGNLHHYARIVFSAPNIHHGYHGLRHMLHVTWVCYQACDYYIRLGKMTKREARNLLIAAIFHDYAHCGKSGNDKFNIEIAVEAMANRVALQEDGYIAEIATIIRATQFPHADLGQSITLLQAVIRDADMSQAFGVTWIGDICAGFGSELGKTPVEMLEQQRKFLEHLHFSSDFGHVFFGQAAVDAKEEETLELLKILDPD